MYHGKTVYCKNAVGCPKRVTKLKEDVGTQTSPDWITTIDEKKLGSSGALGDHSPPVAQTPQSMFIKWYKCLSEFQEFNMVRIW